MMHPLAPEKVTLPSEQRRAKDRKRNRAYHAKKRHDPAYRKKKAQYWKAYVARRAQRETPEQKRKRLDAKNLYRKIRAAALELGKTTREIKELWGLM